MKGESKPDKTERVDRLTLHQQPHLYTWHQTWKREIVETRRGRCEDGRNTRVVQGRIFGHRAVRGGVGEGGGCLVKPRLFPQPFHYIGDDIAGAKKVANQLLDRSERSRGGRRSLLVSRETSGAAKEFPQPPPMRAVKARINPASMFGYKVSPKRAILEGASHHKSNPIL